MNFTHKKARITRKKNRKINFYQQRKLNKNQK